MDVSRRVFARRIGAAATCLALGSLIARRAPAYPLGLQPGVQLWSVKDSLESDPAGTLRKIGAMGYREVEVYELPRSPVEFKKRCDEAGLKIVGGHFYLQSLASRRTIDVALQLGMRYIIVVFPTLRSMSASSSRSRTRFPGPRLSIRTRQRSLDASYSSSGCPDRRAA